MEKILLGIDVGTSACKVAAFDLEGRVVAQSTKPYNVYYPAPDCVEQNPLEWWDGVCDAIFEPTYSTPKILWFKEHKPDVFKNTYKFLQSNSFIVFKLTGVMSQDICQGYGLHVFNMKTGKWEDGLCEEMGVPREMLPEIYACHQVVGEVTAEAAATTGLAEGIPVVAGGLDAACGTLGAGVIDIGQTQEQGGQAGGMSICVGEALAHPKLILSFHVVPDLWLLQGGTVGGGGTIKWFRQELGAFETEEEKRTGVSAFKIVPAYSKSRTQIVI